MRLDWSAPAARAFGSERDSDGFPFGISRFIMCRSRPFNAGDVFARAFVRWLEIQRWWHSFATNSRRCRSARFAENIKAATACAMVVSLVEGWRGEICHVAMTDERGRFSHYKVVDPSFHNWMGLAMAVRNQQISDFPLCNKSFNLSYCGHDL